MKPDKESSENDATSLTGDAIGDTAYSERFVLKILLKLANLDSLRDEIKEKSFEDDLCTLWDMAAERDVVLFLQKHDVLDLFHFALPIVESARIIEIIIGIIGNMCCHKEATTTLLKMETFSRILLEYIKTDDSLILIQLLRLVNSSLFLAEENELYIWMTLYEQVDYSEALYFILKNSSSKELLITALENLNTICSYCNSEKTRAKFFTLFVTSQALDGLTSAFIELIVNQKECERDEIERVLVITLQITLNIVGFEKSFELYNESKENIITVINHVLRYYEGKLVNLKEIDSDLVDIIDSTNTIVNALHLSKTSDPDCYFTPCYQMWRIFTSATKSHQNGHSDFEDNDESLAQFSKQIKLPLSNLLCNYFLKCTESQLLIAFDRVNADYEMILSDVQCKETKKSVSERTSSYRTRLKDNVDS